MNKFLLTVHVLAAILAIGPVAVAASMFPPAARRALAAPQDESAAATLRLLHRICRVYAVVGVVVPVFGFATASGMGVLGSAWLIASIVLTALAAVVLAALVLPAQTALLEEAAATARATSPGQTPSPGHATLREEAAGTDRTAPAARTAGPARPPLRRGAAGAGRAARLAMFTGMFNLLWATVTVLMIVRPGSTTGA
ncbi:DUF2269 family protein [Streptomyces sp. NPDC006193]|uniref:DUF2269 family protein n=1 Tax=Streptomyces sp. NPDC006193 TaxID=3155717 RepID=UPI0033A83A39